MPFEVKEEKIILFLLYISFEPFGKVVSLVSLVGSINLKCFACTCRLCKHIHTTKIASTEDISSMAQAYGKDLSDSNF